MATPKADKERLYKTLKAQGLNIGTYDEFDASLANKDDRDWYYRKAKINGMNVGTPEEFESAYTPVAAPAPKPQPPRQAAPRTQRPAQAPQTATAAPPAPKPTPTPQAAAPQPKFAVGNVVSIGGKLYRFDGMQNGKALVQRDGANSRSLISIADLNRGQLHSAKAWQPSSVQMQAMQDQFAQQNAALRQQGQQAQQRLKNQQQYMQSGKSVGMQTAEGGFQLNPETGQFEQTYLTPDGGRTFNKAQADMATSQMRLQRGEEQRAAALAANHGYKAMEERLAEVDREMRQIYDKRAQEWDSERDPHRKKGESGWDAFVRSFGSTVAEANRNMHPTPSGHDAGIETNANSDDERLKQLMAERMQLNKAMRRIELEAAHKANDDAPGIYRWALNSWEGNKDKLTDPATLTMGMTNMSIAGEVSHAAKQSGNATEGQERLLQSDDMANQAIGEIGSLGASDVAGTVVGMVLDPTTYIAGGAGSLAAQGVMKLGGRYFLKGATSAVGKRYMASTLGGRLIAGAAGGSVNFGTYEGLKEVQRELPTGDLDAGTILSETGHGLLIGSATGTVSPLLGNVADKVVKGTTSTIGKAGVRTGELATSVVAEGTIFSLPEWINPEGKDRFDIWTDNMAMMLGFKASHAVKSAPRVIAELKEDYQRKDKRNGLSFEERLRRNLDRSPSDVDFSQEELDELSRKGYDDLSTLFKKDNTVFEKSGDGQWRAVGTKETVGQKPEFDGYDRMEFLIQDNEVSEAARAKAYYFLTGRCLPMSTVTGCTTIENPDGSITVNATNARGGVVTSRRFKSKRLAEEEKGKIQRQAELNSVDVGERAKEVVQDYAKFDGACQNVAMRHGYVKEAVIELYKRARNPQAHPDEITKGERYLANEIDKEMEKAAPFADLERPANIRERIKEERGIDIDKVLSTQPKKRTIEEQEALEDYMRQLYPRNEASEQPESGEAEQAATGPEYNANQIGNDNDIGQQPQAELAERRIDAAAVEVDARANDDDGMVHGLTMKLNDRRVYLKKGRIVMTDDGTMVDTRASDHDLWIYDPATGKTEMTTPDAIFTVDEPIAADQLKEEAAQQVHDEAQQADKYQKGFITIRDAEGNERRGTVTGERGEDGRIRVFVESGDDEGTGEFMEFTPEELDVITVDYKPETPTEETPPEQPTEAPTEETIEEQPADEQPTEPQPPENIAPENIPTQEQAPSEVAPQAPAQGIALSRIPKDKEGNPDFQAVDPETAEAGLTEFMGNEADAAEYAAGMEQDALAEVKKTSAAINKVPFSRNAAAWKEAKAIAKHADDEARRKLEHWRSVLKIYKDRAEAKRAQEAEAQKAASQERFMEEKKRKEQLANEMQAAGGANSVHPSIAKKWSDAPKTDGNTDVLKYGDMALPGHYVLVEAGAATASHDPKNAYQPTEGFPQDENGANINDRDYEHDTSAQKYVESIAADYDQQAIQDPVVVSPDGVVLSGNNRTMSGDIAAINGTDGKYVDYLKTQAAKFGFTPEQVGAMKHPRVLFVTDQRLPYTTETMAHFNKRTTKSMPMDAEAIANGKRVSDDTFGAIVRSMLPYERVSDFANSKDGVASLYQLVESGALSDKELAKMLTPDKTKLSGSGIEQVMSVLIGKAFQGNEKAVYELLNTPTMRNNVMMALGEIAANRTLADGYTLADELAEAVDLCYRARNSAPENPFPEGTPVSLFAMQRGIDFDAVDPYEIKDPTQGTVLLLADLLNAKETAQLRKILADYNDKAREAAAGQLDMFTGEADSRETILKRLNDFYNNATRKEQLRRQAEIIEQRRQAAGQEPTEAGHAPAGGGNGPTPPRDNGAEPQDAPEGEGIRPIGFGDFGPIYDQFKGNPHGAIRQLIKMQDGEALAALSHKEVGEIDLVWGVEGTGHSDGYGLAKLIKYHPEVALKLQEILDDMHVAKRSSNRVTLESEKYLAAIRLTWNNVKKNWLLTAFEKKEASAPVVKTTDTDENPLDLQGDTALLQDADASEDKVTKSPQEKQAKKPESSDNEEPNGFTPDELAEAKEIADSFTGTNLRGEIQRKMHIGYDKAGKIVDALKNMPTDKPDTDDETRGYDDYELAEAKRIARDYGEGNLSHILHEKMGIGMDKALRLSRALNDMAKDKPDTDDEPDAPVPVEPTPDKQVQGGGGYTVEPTPYTNKKGKTTDCFLVKFDRELTKAERDALNEYCKEPLSAGSKTGKGWFDRVKGGWMMRSEDAAKGLADIIGDESGEAVADNAPLTLADLKAESQEPRAERPTPSPMNQVNVEDLLADVNNMVQHPGVHRGEVKLSDHSKPVKPEQPTTPTLKDVAKSDWGKEHLVIGGAGIGKEPAKPEPERQVSDEEMSSLADQLRDILGEDNDGADNNILFRDGNGELTKAEKMKVFTIGTQIAMGMIERGTVDFPDFAAKLIKGIGESVRPFIKSFYSGAMRMPGMEGYRYTPQAEVDAFDIANFDAQRGVIAAAQQKVNEQQAQDIMEDGARELKRQRNERRKAERETSSSDTGKRQPKPTPLMKQWQEMKKKHPDAILLFRVGDFYEVYSRDAVDASEILGITLTRRANGRDAFVELAGFPHHALDTYLPRLIRAGRRVAICEQLSDPKETQKIVETVTPLKGVTDVQGNSLNPDGTLKVEKIDGIEELTGEDFILPRRNVQLPELPEKVREVLGTDGRPVVIKKNIFERNKQRHPELTPSTSRVILKKALYEPMLYGRTQPVKRPNNWILVNVPDGNGNNKLVLLEINSNKENVEIVHWHEVDDKGLEKLRKQAEREDGQLLILPSAETEEAGALSGPALGGASMESQAIAVGGRRLTLESAAGNTRDASDFNDKVTEFTQENQGEENPFSVNEKQKFLVAEIERHIQEYAESVEAVGKEATGPEPSYMRLWLGGHSDEVLRFYTALADTTVPVKDRAGAMATAIGGIVKEAGSQQEALDLADGLLGDAPVNVAPGVVMPLYDAVTEIWRGRNEGSGPDWTATIDTPASKSTQGDKKPDTKDIDWDE